MTNERIKLSNAQQILLAELARRTDFIDNAERPPDSQPHALASWRDQRTYGPQYSCSRWFGRVSPSERQRYYRALRTLEQAELVEASRIVALRSRQQVFLRLTPTGEKLAREMLAAQFNN